MTDTSQSLTTLSRTLVAVGGLNWGLVGLFGLDLVAAIFGDRSKMSRAIYTSVGVATAYTAVNAARSSAR